MYRSRTRKRRLLKPLLLIIVLLAVGAAGFMLGKNNYEELSSGQSHGEESIYSNASDLRKDLNIALAEHVALTTETLRASYDNDASSTATVDALDQNSRRIADILGGFYGEESKATFLKIWQDQITYFVNYTISAKNNDQEGKEQALSDLENHSRDSAEFFAGLNSALTTEITKPLFTKHRDLMIASINDYIEEKYAESLNKESETFGQAGKIADTLSDGVIKQFPDKFSE